MQQTQPQARQSYHLKLMKISRVFLCLLLSLQIGCSSNKEKILNQIAEIAAKDSFRSEIFHTQNFDIFTLQKITNPKQDLKIYIEGDGFAYVNRHTPSIDPTPRSLFLLNLATQDQSPNILYIARPCQYVFSKNCEEKYWTEKRFSKEAVSAIQEVIDHFSNYPQHLIGYSGGAAIINHLHHQKTKTILTIAGNLDLETFTKIHKISPLIEEKIDYQKLSTIPQIHLIGSADKIIPLTVFEAYSKKLPRKDLVKMKIVEGATHSSGWENF